MDCGAAQLRGAPRRHGPGTTGCLRILVVQESDWIRRNPVQQHQMLERLSAAGHEVTVVDYPIRWRDEGAGLIAPRRTLLNVRKVVPTSAVTVVRTAKVRVPGLGKLTWLATNVTEIESVLRRRRPDLVVALGLSNSLPALWLAKRRGIPVVVHLIDALHTLAEPGALRPVAAAVERRLLRGADAVITISAALRDYAVAMGASPSGVTVIPSGADLDRLGPGVDGRPARRELGIRDGDFVIIFVGWLYEFSGLKEVAEALVADRDRWSRITLLVVGDGDLLPDLARLRDQGPGGAKLVLAGHQPAHRIPDYLAASDACLLPARVNDTMRHIVPAKVQEYLAAGRPVLASPLPGLMREFGGDSGIVYVSSPNELLGEAQRLAEEPQRCAELARSARRAAEALGTWEEATARYLQVLASHAEPVARKRAMAA